MEPSFLVSRNHTFWPVLYILLALLWIDTYLVKIDTFSFKKKPCLQSLVPGRMKLAEAGWLMEQTKWRIGLISVIEDSTSTTKQILWPEELYTNELSVSFRCKKTVGIYQIKYWNCLWRKGLFMIRLWKQSFYLHLLKYFFAFIITVFHEIFLKGQVWSKDEIYQQHYEV